MFELYEGIFEDVTSDILEDIKELNYISKGDKPMKAKIRIIEITPSYSYEYFKRRIKKLNFYTVTDKEIREICEDIESDIECKNLTENEKIVLHKLLILKVLFNK